MFQFRNLLYLLRVSYDNINKDRTFVFFGQPPCFNVRDEDRDEIFWP